MIHLAGEALDEVLRAFLSEDVGGGDVTTEATIASGTRARGRLVARSECVVSGLSVAQRTFELLDLDLGWNAEVSCGQHVAPNATVAHLNGRARAILTAERVALNLLQRMTGIATATRRFVDAVAGTSCRILDTRKTAPGLRAFDRAAVLDGGGANHRWGLSDMVLIKDNHRRLAGGVHRAVAAVRRGARPGLTIEVEVETEEELLEALRAGVDAILIDNQPPETVRRWVEIARRGPSPPSLEASGGMSLENVRDYALAGVDSISVGALTHSVRAADLALEVEAP
jgi:nicotinate-nucleotide pyrophosphorylase (carboxylating)